MCLKGSLHPGLAGGKYQILFSLCKSEKHRFSVRRALLRVLAPQMCLERGVTFGFLCLKPGFCHKEPKGTLKEHQRNTEGTLKEHENLVSRFRIDTSCVPMVASDQRSSPCRASYAMAKFKQVWLCSFGLNGTFKIHLTARRS